MDSTKDYVTNARQNREDYARDLLARLDSDDRDAAESADDELNEWPLSVEIVRHVEILLSTGGPAEWLDVTVDSDDCTKSVTFHAVWGGESVTVPVYANDALWTVADRFLGVVES